MKIFVNMRRTHLYRILFLLAGMISIVLVVQAKNPKPNDHVFCFYYNWYGNEERNGKEIHWAHNVMNRSSSDGPEERIPGKDNIASNFFPQLKNYSSTDPAIVKRHMKMMADAGIGVIVLTWWRTLDFGSESVSLIMDEAHKAGLKVCFHLEPYQKRSAATVRQDIGQILDTYGRHPAFFRTGGKPWFFIYDSYLTKADEWHELLTSSGSMTIRNTPLDAVMIGLWVEKGEEPFFEQSGFDGYYTYFGATNFTYGASPENWRYLQQWAADHGKTFIPCVGPGYIDTRVRPWNGATTRDRENGKYYDRMFQAAIYSKASYVGITSFNEWHEGTQIEPAIPFESPGFKYLDYAPLAPDYYLKRTGYWVGEMERRRSK